MATALACSAHQVEVTDGSDLTASESARIEIVSGLVLDAVDGDTTVHGSPTKQRPLTLHVAPGMHTLTLHYRSQSGSDQRIMQTVTTTESDPLDFEISVDGGESYTVYPTVNGDIWGPHIRKKAPAD